jgi:NAD(P)-dependent dehydrogenase (short-subunit alcohol dehydrogenase family)
VSAQGQRFAGQVAIITGGSSGIGRETASGLLAGGARVAIGDIREPQELSENDRILFVSADMRRARDC